jgi:hypothetical protein
MDLGNCDGFPQLDMELDLSVSRHGGGSLALCHRGRMKNDFLSLSLLRCTPSSC